MGTKLAVSFANIFMAKIETELLSKGSLNIQFGNSKGKAETGLHGLPMWFLWLRRMIRAFKL